MSSYHPTTLGYFSAPPGHLWEWHSDDDRGCIVWHGDGGLIVYREELETLLDACTPRGLPPLGALLLVVAAAQVNYSADNTLKRLWAAAERATGSREIPTSIADLWTSVGISLEQLHALPAELRASGPARCHLLQILFSETVGDVFRNVNPSHARDIVTEFKQTPYVDAFQQRSPDLNGVARLLADLSALRKIFSSCPPETLEQRLRTGLDQMPSRPIQLPFPQADETPAPEVPADLLRALEREGGELAQVAGLARRMSAILHVPKSVTHRDEMPLGGVSDITNRGDPSRLLMTELAWDDLTFAVRISQGEALYLRRESPPAEPPPRRLILIDTGIFMWGKPRLFALGVALALLRQKQDSHTVGARVMASEGNEFTPITLDSLDDVRAQLSRLQPHPHPSLALGHLLETDEKIIAPEEEVFLITHPSVCEQLTTLPVWQSLARTTTLHTLVVDRDGALQLARHSLAGTKILSEARVAAEDLFEAPKSAKKDPAKPSPAALTSEAGRLPRFYQRWPWPLFHPSPPVQRDVFEIPGKGYIGMSEAGCVSWWPKKQASVSQVLLINKPAGDLCGAAQDKQDDNFIILAFRDRGDPMAEFAIIHLKEPDTNEVYRVEISRSDIMMPCWNSGRLIIHLDDRSDAYHILDDAVKVASTRRSDGNDWPVFDGTKFNTNRDSQLPCTLLTQTKNIAEHLVARRCLINVNGVALHGMGDLMILSGDHAYRLKVNPDSGLVWEGCSASRRDFKALLPVAMPNWKDYGLKVALFPDGRRVVVDPRGFIHICDSGEEADEISVILVRGHTAAWIPQNKYFGESDLISFSRTSPMSEVTGLCQKLFRPPT